MPSSFVIKIIFSSFVAFAILKDRVIKILVN